MLFNLQMLVSMLPLHVNIKFSHTKSWPTLRSDILSPWTTNRQTSKQHIRFPSTFFVCVCSTLSQSESDWLNSRRTSIPGDQLTALFRPKIIRYKTRLFSQRYKSYGQVTVNALWRGNYLRLYIHKQMLHPDSRVNAGQCIVHTFLALKRSFSRHIFIHI